MSTKTLRTMDEIIPEIEAKKEALDKALESNEYTAVNDAKFDLSQLIGEFNTASRDAELLELLKTEMPVLSAVMQYTYPTKKLASSEDADGKISFSIENAEAKIDLIALARMGKDRKIAVGAPDMVAAVENLLFLFALRAAKGVVSKTPKNFRDTVKMSRLAAQLNDGKTITSNSNMIKEVQVVVDKMHYIDDNGKNKYKVTKHEVAYLENLIYKKGKEVCSLKVTTTGDFMNSMVQMLRHLITGTNFTFAVAKKENKNK